VLNWTEADASRTARWRSESGSPPPKRVMLADDRLAADAAYRLASEGTALLWRGDFQNARQLLQAMARRIDRKPRKPAASPIEAFNFYRQASPSAPAPSACCCCLWKRITAFPCGARRM